MKNMKKTLFLLGILLTGFSAFSQNKNTGAELSIGVDGGFPLNSNFKDSHKFGIGGTAKFAYNFDENLALTLQSGYISFAGKDETIAGVTFKGESVHFIPVKVGGRYTFSNGIFLEPQLGVSFIGGSGSSTSAFTYAFNAGYRTTPGIDISARYEGASKNGTLSFLGIRLAYSFSLGGK
jgi:hypothetical protein